MGTSNPAILRDIPPSKVDQLVRTISEADLFLGKEFQGGTFTGTTFRTSATGERTEMTSQGIKVFNGADIETVRIGHGVTTGMAVRNPRTGNMVELTDALFRIAPIGIDPNLYLGMNPPGRYPENGTKYMEFMNDSITVPTNSLSIDLYWSHSMVWKGSNDGNPKGTARYRIKLDFFDKASGDLAASTYGETTGNNTNTPAERKKNVKGVRVSGLTPNKEYRVRASLVVTDWAGSDYEYDQVAVRGLIMLGFAN